MSQVNIQESIEQFITEITQDTDVFLLKLDINSKNDIKVYLDADKGLDINTISQINRKLYKKIEEAELIRDNDFSIEVGSLGVDEPLVLVRQYNKHIGRNLEVTLEDSVIEGKLIEVLEDSITIHEITDKKTKKIQEHNILFNNIKKAIVQISF